MSDVHALGIPESSRQKLESVDPKFIKQGLLTAREKSWEVFEEVKNLLKEGMTEEEGRKLCYSAFETRGVTQHWHKPHARFGPGTILNFNHSTQKDYRLQKNDPVFLDLGPIWKNLEGGLDYEGDVGDTFVFGENPEAKKCADTARKLFVEAASEWKTKKLSGEAIYAFLRKRAREEGYELVEQVDGHRVSDYPHHKYTKERLSCLNFVPTETLWILELQIKHPTLSIGAFFEDIL